MGIGAATCERLANEGGRVIIADIDDAAAAKLEARIGQCGGAAWRVHVDLAEPGSIEAMGRAVAQHTEALHGLVNNCGIVMAQPISETCDADWTPQVAINLRAPVLCAKALLPLLKKGPGHIVNLSSEGGFRPRPNLWVYDVTKLGVCSATRTMACEFVPFGIRANAVAPGWIVTEMHFRNAPDPAACKRELEELAWDGAIIPRLGRPEEVAATIAFLLSDDASYITATTFHVDGGRVAR